MCEIAKEACFPRRAKVRLGRRFGACGLIGCPKGSRPFFLCAGNRYQEARNQHTVRNIPRGHRSQAPRAGGTLGVFEPQKRIALGPLHFADSKEFTGDVQRADFISPFGFRSPAVGLTIEQKSVPKYY